MALPGEETEPTYVRVNYASSTFLSTRIYRRTGPTGSWSLVTTRGTGTTYYNTGVLYPGSYQWGASRYNANTGKASAITLATNV